MNTFLTPNEQTEGNWDFSKPPYFQHRRGEYTVILSKNIKIPLTVTAAPAHYLHADAMSGAHVFHDGTALHARVAAWQRRTGIFCHYEADLNAIRD